MHSLGHILYLLVYLGSQATHPHTHGALACQCSAGDPKDPRLPLACGCGEESCVAPWLHVIDLHALQRRSLVI